jgi:hypothetical protein
MKRWILTLLVLLVLVIASVYLFFPKEVIGSNIEKIGCSINGINRFVMAENKWKAWWPGKVVNDTDSQKYIFEYNGYKYIITRVEYNAILIDMQGLNLNINGTIFFLPLKIDSVQAEWKYVLKTTSNPVNRIHLYLTEKNINSNMKDILRSMKSFLDKKENVYGMKINQVMVKDTILMFTEYNSEQYPSTRKIYSLIDGIKNYIASNHAEETNYPMLNVTNSDSGYYKVKVAIPVNKEIPQNRTYTMRRMVPGKILVGQVMGGSYRAREALRELGLYIADYEYSSPAIPFQSLVTNRMEEPDSTKWVTRVYYPIF